MIRGDMDVRRLIETKRGRDQELPLRVYTPEALILSPRTLFADMAHDLWRSRELAWRLAIRDVRSQYRGSLLGYFWAFITPLFSTAVWVFLSTTGVVKVASTDIPYPAYVFSGTMLWQIFTEALSSPLGQINASRSMLAKLNFPREALILSGAIKVIFNAVVKVMVLVPALFLFGVFPDAHMVYFPLAVGVLILVGLSVGLLLAPLGTLYTDIGRFIPLVTQLLMYLTPVVFAMPTAGTMARLFGANPLTPVVLTARAWLTGAESPMFTYFLAVAGCASVLLLIGWFLYRITMPVLIERMSS
jgi:lipopolysaccharide transport system permease protein